MKTINYRATDLRDKVFALLGLLNGSCPIIPNYNESVSQVYIAAFKFILLQDGNLRNFCWLLGGEETRDNELPSWVPDFQSNSLSRRCVTISASEEAIGQAYHASTCSSKRPDVELVFDEGDRVLIVRGIIVAAIDCLGDVAPKAYLANAEGEPYSMHHVIMEWKRLADNRIGDQYVTGCSKLDAFWRTITLDRKVFGYHSRSAENLTGQKRRLEDADEGTPPSDPLEERRLIKAMDKNAGGLEGGHFSRRFFITAGGYMGLGPPITHLGDLICVLFGAEVPYVLRPLDGGYYKMIGECYMHGVMDGEVIEDAEKGRYIYQSFALK